jgi:parvulin-like peptidyl-prolyl isomerase
MPSREARRAQKQLRKGEQVSETLERRHQSHPFIYGFSIVVLVVIVVTFVLAGPGGPLGSRSGAGSIVFGTYNGQDIAYYPGSYFAQQLQTISNQYSQSGTSTDTQATQQAIYYQAFYNTAVHIALLQEAERADVAVSEDALTKALLSYPAYLDENGKFSEERYRNAAASDKASARTLTRDDLVQNILVQDLFTGVKTGAREAQFIKDMVRPERSFQFVSWQFSSFPAAEVRTYGEANRSRFVRIKLSRILVTSGESQANEIRRKIVDKTSTFEELAKTYSKDSYADKGGDMGWRYAYDLEADFDNKDNAKGVLALKVGELSDVLKGTYGWLIYRCDAEAVDADFSNPSVQADVKTYLTTYEKGKIEDYFSGQAGQFSRLASEAGYDRAVKEMGLKTAETVAFPVNLSNVFSFAPVQAVQSADTPTAAQNNEDFFFRAFSLAKDQVSAPIVLDDRVLVLKVKSEQQMPEGTLSLLDSWVAYISQQSVQTDLSAALMTPEKLKDNFAATFAGMFTSTGRAQ